jgi:hypothetical protein
MMIFGPPSVALPKGGCWMQLAFPQRLLVDALHEALAIVLSVG